MHLRLSKPKSLRAEANGHRQRDRRDSHMMRDPIGHHCMQPFLRPVDGRPTDLLPSYDSNLFKYSSTLVLTNYRACMRLPAAAYRAAWELTRNAFPSEPATKRLAKRHKLRRARHVAAYAVTQGIAALRCPKVVSRLPSRSTALPQGSVDDACVSRVELDCSVRVTELQSRIRVSADSASESDGEWQRAAHSVSHGNDSSESLWKAFLQLIAIAELPSRQHTLARSCKFHWDARPADKLALRSVLQTAPGHRGLWVEAHLSYTQQCESGDG